MYPLHKNETGSFQELVHASEVEFGQLSLLTIAPGCERGGHYHTRKREWFCCLHGSCTIVLRSPDGDLIGLVAVDENRREFIQVLPGEVHTVVNSHNVECELLIICNEVYDQDDTDTVKWEAKEVKGEPVCSIA
jgi:UDP-2-acetamido-2,6-beta-L-arabino-hexul-4-ose reductase